MEPHLALAVATCRLLFGPDSLIWRRGDGTKWLHPGPIRMPGSDGLIWPHLDMPGSAVRSPQTCWIAVRGWSNGNRGADVVSRIGLTHGNATLFRAI
jgi:hypothetical protein